MVMIQHPFEPPATIATRQSQSSPENKNREIKDFREYNKEDIGPLNKKKINTIILQTDSFIVYLDQDLDVMWTVNDDYDGYPDDFGVITNEVAHMETLIERHLQKKEFYEFKMLAAEGMARVLDDKSCVNASTVLKKAYDELIYLVKEKLRISYLKGSMSFTALVLVLLVLCLVFKLQIKEVSNDSYLLVVSCLCGGLGAFISSFITSRTYNANPAIGANIHYLDGAFRIVYGVVAAFFLYLGIKANAVLGFVDTENTSNYIYYFFCALAGASEVLIPNIIKQKENEKA
jgi:hypothetical protein